MYKFCWMHNAVCLHLTVMIPTIEQNKCRNDVTAHLSQIFAMSIELLPYLIHVCIFCHCDLPHPIILINQAYLKYQRILIAQMKLFLTPYLL